MFRPSATALLLNLFLATALSGQSIDRLQRAVQEARRKEVVPDHWESERRKLRSVRTAFRDWVMRQLPPGIPDSQRDLSPVAQSLNRVLKNSGVSVGLRNDDNPFEGDHGVEVELRRNDKLPAYVEMRLSVATACGDDVSIYFLQWAGGAWRIRASVDGESNGVPVFSASVEEVAVSDPDADGHRLLFAMRHANQCSSAWSRFNYDIFRIGPGGDAQQLRSASHEVYDGHEDLQFRLTADGVLMEFADSSIDSARHSRPHILNFTLSGDRVERIAPIALRPSDFVDEWVSIDWTEAAKWSVPSNAATLRSWHDRKLKGDFGVVQKCTDQSRWLVEIISSNDAPFYFVVRDDSDYQYLMLDVASRRPAGCPGRSFADSERPSLFKKPGR